MGFLFSLLKAVLPVQAVTHPIHFEDLQLTKAPTLLV